MTGPYFVGEDSDLGGLVGSNDGSIVSSYATGKVEGVTSGPNGGDWNFGGLVGINRGSISDSYATGNVAGLLSVGGLVGANGGAAFNGGSPIGGTITNSYATGTVTGSEQVGGLVGVNGTQTYVESPPGKAIMCRKASPAALPIRTRPVRSNGVASDSRYVGGLVGENLAAMWRGLMLPPRRAVNGSSVSSAA